MSNTLANLKAQCAGFHKKTASDLTINSQDFFLAAANMVVKNAQLLHNFEYTRVQATLDIDGTTGGRLSNAVMTNVEDGGQVVVTGTLSPNATGTYILVRGVAGNTNALYVLQDLTHAHTQLFNITGQWFIVDYTTGDSWTGPLDSTGNPAGTYTPSGGNTGTATVTFTLMPTFSGIREVVAVQRTNSDGTLSPLDFTRADIPIERDRYKIELSDNYDLEYRYPSDARFLSRGTDGSIIQRKQSLFIYPVPATSVDMLHCTLEGYGWLSQYAASNLSDTGPTDFFVEHGYEWLMWSIVCQLNFYFKTFVQRSEGNLAPPDQQRQQAWQDLLVWDSYLVDSNSSRPR